MLQKLRQKVLGESVAEKARTDGSLPARDKYKRKVVHNEAHRLERAFSKDALELDDGKHKKSPTQVPSHACMYCLKTHT